MQQILIIILIVAVLAAVGGIFYWLIKATAKIESGAPETAQKPTEKPAEARVEQKGGLKIEVLKEGSGPQAGGGAKAGNTVAIKKRRGGVKTPRPLVATQSSVQLDGSRYMACHLHRRPVVCGDTFVDEQLLIEQLVVRLS